MVSNFDFVTAFNFVMTCSVMYLWSSGEEYMTKAANDSGRSGRLDRILLGIIGSVSFYGMFYRDWWIPYAQLTPLFLHLIQITFLSWQFRRAKYPYKSKILTKILKYFTHEKIIHN